jgi:hypothetical protein
MSIYLTLDAFSTWLAMGHGAQKLNLGYVRTISGFMGHVATKRSLLAHVCAKPFVAHRSLFAFSATCCQRRCCLEVSLPRVRKQ